jgi:hypothetical protein
MEPSKKKKGFLYKAITIWIDKNVNSQENIMYREMMDFDNHDFAFFIEINEAFNYIKQLKFISTYIIISGKYYFDFIDKLKNNLNDIFIIPKIIIFTSDKKLIYERNKNNGKNYLDNEFYNYGKVHTSIVSILDFYNKEVNIYKTISDQDEFIFQINNCFEFKEINVNNLNNSDIKQLNEYLFLKSYSYKNIEPLFFQTLGITQIPINVLIKFYVEAIRLENNFIKEITNEKLYKTFIAIIQTAFSNQYIINDISNINQDCVFCPCLFSNNELNDLLENYNNNNKIIYLNKILYFTTNENYAKNIINNYAVPMNNNSILLILEKKGLNNNFISYKKNNYNEYNFILFPFTSFEIKYMLNIMIKNETRYIIHLNKKQEKLNFNNILDCFICPITQDVMKNPVVTKYGHSYEKSAIENWIETHQNDPMTKEHLTKNDIFPNYQLKIIIEKYRESIGKNN